MAWLEERNGRFHVCFRYGEQKVKKSLKTGDRKLADQLRGRVEENLALVERGRLSVPEGADLGAFLLSDGRVERKSSPQKPQTIAGLFAEYEGDMPAGAMEANSLYTARIHMRHVERVLGKRLVIATLDRDALQKYVNSRSAKVAATTIRKELATLSAVWSYAAGKGYVAGGFPNKGLKYPKVSEKPPFQTWQEISRWIERGSLSDEEQDALWDCLFLTLPEIDGLTAFVEKAARHPFLYPMVMTAAHTGARRSELMRSRVGDVDLAGRSITIREKKRAQGRNTARSVPLSPRLHECLSAWLAVHPGGDHTFCHNGLPLTRDKAHDHLKRTLAGSKWQVVRGWHVLRHSFASNCAAAGVDQRLIDAWMGHQTVEMQRRYRHQFPDQQQQAIESVFGGQ